MHLVDQPIFQTSYEPKLAQYPTAIPTNIIDSTIFNSIFQKNLPFKLIRTNNYSSWNIQLKVYFMGQNLWDMIASHIQPQKSSGKQPILIKDFLIIYITLKKFYWKNQQVMTILIGHFNNNIFLMVQHIIKNNQKKYFKIIWDILNTIYTEKKFNYKI